MDVKVYKTPDGWAVSVNGREAMSRETYGVVAAVMRELCGNGRHEHTEATEIADAIRSGLVRVRPEVQS